MRSFVIVCAAGFSLAGLGLAAFSISATAGREDWPVQNLSNEALVAAQKVRDQYRAKGLTSVEAQNYTARGEYLDWGAKGPLKETPGEIPLGEGGIKLDSEGLPLVKRRHIEGLHFNPVTLAQFALSVHGQYVRGEKSEDLFLRAASRLVERQETDGSFRYNFYFRHYSMKEPYKDGWISGMAQGQALSVFARAYLITGDPKFKMAGDAALNFLFTKQENGGPATTLSDLDPSLSQYTFLEEYVTDPDVYTLNGYIFTLLGIYDWWDISRSDITKKHFDDGIAALFKMLPLYNISGVSSYDLSYLTVKNQDGPSIPHMSPEYHSLHIQLLLALHSITSERAFKETADLWRMDTVN